MDATDDQIEAARTKVRNMLHAADHGNHVGEVAVMRMAASEEMLAAFQRLVTYYEGGELHDEGAYDQDCEECQELQAARSAISKAEGSTLMERRV